MVDRSGGVGISVSTIFYATIAIIGYFVTPKGPNRGVTQTMIVTTCVCLWLFYLFAYVPPPTAFINLSYPALGLKYMAQLRPLIGPELKVEDIIAINHDDCQEIYQNHQASLCKWKTACMAYADELPDVKTALEKCQGSA